MFLPQNPSNYKPSTCNPRPSMAPKNYKGKNTHNEKDTNQITKASIKLNTHISKTRLYSPTINSDS